MKSEELTNWEIQVANAAKAVDDWIQRSRHLGLSKEQKYKAATLVAGDVNRVTEDVQLSIDEMARYHRYVLIGDDQPCDCWHCAPLLDEEEEAENE